MPHHMFGSLLNIWSYLLLSLHRITQNIVLIPSSRLHMSMVYISVHVAMK